MDQAWVNVKVDQAQAATIGLTPAVFQEYVPKRAIQNNVRFGVSGAGTAVRDGRGLLTALGPGCQCRGDLVARPVRYRNVGAGGELHRRSAASRPAPPPPPATTVSTTDTPPPGASKRTSSPRKTASGTRPPNCQKQRRWARARSPQPHCPAAPPATAASAGPSYLRSPGRAGPLSQWRRTASGMTPSRSRESSRNATRCLLVPP